jgi:hypothetical protein
MWRDKSLLLVKPLPHSAHTNGLAPVWVCMWQVRLLLQVKPLPHSAHLNDLATEGLLMLLCAEEGDELVMRVMRYELG